MPAVSDTIHRHSAVQCGSFVNRDLTIKPEKRDALVARWQSVAVLGFDGFTSLFHGETFLMHAQGKTSVDFHDTHSAN